MGLGIAVGLGLGLGLGVGVRLGVRVGVALGRGVAVAVALGVGVALGLGLGLGVGLGGGSSPQTTSRSPMPAEGTHSLWFGRSTDGNEVDRQSTGEEEVAGTGLREPAAGGAGGDAVARWPEVVGIAGPRPIAAVPGDAQPIPGADARLQDSARGDLLLRLHVAVPVHQRQDHVATGVEGQVREHRLRVDARLRPPARQVVLLVVPG